MSRKALKRPERKGGGIDRRLVAAAAPWFFAANWDHLIVNDDFVRMMVVDGYRSYEDLNWGEVFMGFSGVNAPISLVMRKPDPDAIRSALNRTANEAEVWSADRINETYVDRKKREYEAEQASVAADLIIRTNAALFETYLYMGIHAASASELDAKTESVRQMLKGALKSASTYAANQEEMFFAASPFLMQDPYLEEVNNWSMPSSTIGQSLLNREKGICDPSGIVFGDDGEQGLVRFNPTINTTNRPNGNMFVEGETGSGKSTLIKHIVLYLRLLYGCRIIINDVDGEMTKLVRSLGGEVVYLDSSSAMLLSPFVPRNMASDADVEDDGGPVTDEEIREARRRALEARVLSTHLPFLANYLTKAFAIEPGSKSLLYLACERAYNACGVANDMTFAEYYAGPQRYPSLRDVYEIVGSLKNSLPEFASQLDKLSLDMMRGVEGADAHLWEDAGGRMPDDNPLVCVNMQGLSADPDMMAAQYYNVLTYEWSQVRTHRYSEERVVIVNDEVHKTANARNIDAAYSLKDMAQRIRKYGAQLICSTQMVSDLLNDSIRDAGEGIVYNCAYQFFGRTSGDLAKPGSNIKEVQSLIDAPDRTMRDLAAAPRGRFIARVGDKQSWLNVMEMPEWELELFGKGGGS